MQKIRHIFFLFLLIGTSFQARATHCMGGEITWKCVGNHTYEFELVFYRDCNGFEINSSFETIEVWGHPSVDNIQVNFIQRIDISPSCTAAAGFVPYDCGMGTGGGNGPGAIEKAIYRSGPITLTGAPPSDGWQFTYQSFSRSSSVTNLSNPTNHGITIAAVMYPNPDVSGNCIGSSPIFLQTPYIVTCAGADYVYNPHAVDHDFDSLHFSWGRPLDYFPTGSYNPPNNPGFVSFQPGYTYNNPTPDASFNPNNIPATIDPQTGSIHFKSYTTGNFTIKIKVDAYRKGQKISTIFREMEVMVQNCNGNNTEPIVTPPFNNGTSFDTTIFAGDVIDFDFVAQDLEQLQDGTSQSVTISSTGLMYGSGYTDPTTGCNTPDCAILNAPTITGIQNASMHFHWATNCSHLIGNNGVAKDEIPYIFVFKVKDDYCPAPKVKYYTVKINVKNKNVLPAPKFDCITTDASGNITLNWTAIAATSPSFIGYKIYGINSGNLATISNINTNSFTINANLLTGNPDQFYITTLSGCGGQTERFSDTLSNIFLAVSNPINGTAVLNWNAPATQPRSDFNDLFYIYREYPSGVWTKYDSVPYNTTQFIDTISICQSQINYKIVLPTDVCDFVSNIDGSIFEDMIVPDMPIIKSVSIDTTTGNTVINWNINAQEDTYGYIIYKADNNGNIIPIDTVWGRFNTSYSTYFDPSANTYQYSIAAFDSCYTSNIPPTYHTSAKAQPHTTMLLTSSINTCDRKLELNWSDYIGFTSLDSYHVFAKINGGNWQNLGQTQQLQFALDISVGDEIWVTIQAISDKGNVSFSNIDTVYFYGNAGPSISYLSVATVTGNKIRVKHRISNDGGVAAIQLERYNPYLNAYEVIEEKAISNQNEIIFTDSDVEPKQRSYKYRTKMIDTCGNSLGYANYGKTILLNVITQDVEETHTLQWTPYQQFVGNVMHYEIYRSVNGQFGNAPIAIVPYNIRTYTDTVVQIAATDDGKICYKVIAQEGYNASGVSEKSSSNTDCGVIQPLIYIPNAFTVGGKNPIFKPITRHRKITAYEFTIYNRYGNVIFSTTDPNEGWNGEIPRNHRIAAEGVYIYRLSLRNGNNREIVKFGHVTLLNYNDVNY